MNLLVSRALKYAALIMATATTGCSPGAPTIALFGAYFPIWLLCMLFGVAVALLVRIVLVSTGLTGTLPLQFLVCACAGVTAAIILSWLWLGA